MTKEHIGEKRTSKYLQKLLYLSIGGIFIVVSLGYLFETLMANLDQQTKNTRLKLDIIKQIESKTLDSKYEFIKSLSFIEKNNYNTYKESVIRNIEQSNRYLNILKNGGKVKIGDNSKIQLYIAEDDDISALNRVDRKLFKTIKEYFPIFAKEIEEGIKSRNIKNILSIQKLISVQSEEIIKIFDQRLKILHNLSKKAFNDLQKIENSVESKKALFAYARFFTLLFIITALILTYIPIKEQIIKTNEELEKTTIKALEASKAKSEFLANISHEIRTPLNAILGFIDLLRQEEKNPKKRNYLDTINSSSSALLGIINDILDFSKIESGNLTIDKSDFLIEKEINSIVKLFRAKATEKNISLNLKIGKSIPACLHSDPLRLKQIIANLLSNAIKFTPQNGKVTLYMGYKRERLLVAVKDSGIGIDPKKQESIFKPFIQAENSTTRSFGGTGLGLSISAKLVELLGGRLKVKSKPGKGSTFYFDIEAKPGRYNLPIMPSTNTSGTLKNKRVLLVEDNKANQMFMKIILKQLELDFEIASDGLEAIEMFERSRYDLILMDENMPNLNGIEATKRIREIEKERKLERTPIVALTANALKGDRERFLGNGMDEYLTKPISKEHLYETMRTILLQQEVI